MKTKRMHLAKMAFYTFLCLSLILSGCSGEDGVDGKIGPQGPAGQDGQDGNANVVASDWFEFDWTDPGPLLSEMRIDIPEISGITENGGLVLMYLKMDVGNGNSLTYLLPFYAGNDIVFNYIIVDAPEEEIVGVIVSLEDPGANGVYLDVLNNPDYMLRYVLVPANVASANSRLAIPQTYEEAAALFGLEE